MFGHKGPLESAFLEQSHSRAIFGDTREEFDVFGVIIGGREAVDVMENSPRDIFFGSMDVVSIVRRRSKSFIMCIEYRKVTL